MIRCKRCIIPDTLPGVSFNAEGVCNFCLNYKHKEPLGEEAFEEVLKSCQTPNARYDCVVPLSGGRDSTFVLYLARAKYGLKVLAVSYDNEFREPQALRNMQRACEKLDVELLNVRSIRSVAGNIVKSHLRCAVSFGKFNLCDACEYGYHAVVYRAALERHIALILWGQTSQELVDEMMAGARSVMDCKVQKLWKLGKPSFYLAWYFALRQRMEFPVPGNKVYATQNPRLRSGEISEVRVFDYVRWNRDVMKETLRREVDWEKPEGAISSWRFDCRLHALVNCAWARLFGCTHDSLGYHKMINSGQMSRAEALTQEEEMLGLCTDELARRVLIEDIGLSPKEAERIIGLP